VMLLTRDLGFKNQEQNMTAERVAITNDSTTVFIAGVNDSPGTVPDVIGMGASDAIYLLEKSGLKADIQGFGRVYNQSPTPGMSATKGDLITLQLGFDDLQIVEKDSLNKNDSIQSVDLAIAPPENSPISSSPNEINSLPKQKTIEKPKPSQEAIDKWKAKVAAQKAVDQKKTTKKTTEKPKPNQAAIDKWKAKVAAQKALEAKGTIKKTAVKPKASPEAIAKWKAKVAAQKAAEKKKKSKTVQPKK